MKRFIRSLLLFVGIFFLVLLVLDRSTAFVLQSKVDFTIPSKPAYIVFGHSHSACSFNDSLIHNFYNVSQNGEAYFYTFQKVKELVSHNPEIKTVFIEFSNNQITEKMNEWTWGDKYVTNRYPKLSPFMSADDQFLLASKNFSGFSNGYSVALKSRMSLIASRNFKYQDKLSGYYRLERDDVDSLIAAQQNTDTVLTNDVKISTLNIQYLRKAVEVCRHHNTKIFLVRSPLHRLYRGYAYEDAFQTIIQTEFEDVEFLDFSKFPLSNNEFGDLEHLNYKGARIFSTWFNILLEAGLLSKQNKQQFIDAKMVEFKNQW